MATRVDIKRPGGITKVDLFHSGPNHNLRNALLGEHGFSGNSILEIGRLNKYHGKGRWRKMKGFARIKLDDANIHEAELHWYEAHGIGKKEYKIKQYINK